VKLCVFGFSCDGYSRMNIFTFFCLLLAEINDWVVLYFGFNFCSLLGFEYLSLVCYHVIFSTFILFLSSQT
jgi:hypothetical protein